MSRMNLVNMAGLKPSLEVISFQNDDFPQKLESIIREIMDFHDKNPENGRKNTNSFGLTRKMEDLVYHRLGFKTIFNIETTMHGAIMPFYTNRYHVLLNSKWHGDPLKAELGEQTKILRQLTDKKGTVDIKRARVTGIFSEFTHDVWLDIYGLYKNNNLTSSEITAVVLHEFGHAFTYYEFSDRLNGTNQVLLQMTNELVQNDSVAVREYYVREFAEKLEIDSRELESVLEEDNRVIFGQRIFEHYIKTVGSQVPMSKYNENSSEQLADNFASRFGYGRELITGLDKIWSTQLFGFPPPQKSMPSMIFCYMLEIFLLYKYVTNLWAMIKSIKRDVESKLDALVGDESDKKAKKDKDDDSNPLFDTLGNIYGIYATISALVGMLRFGVSLWNITGDDKEDMTYDLLKVRYTRVKHQYVQLLKDKSLPKEKIQKTIEDIKAMDAIIDETFIYKPLLTHLKNILIPSSRRAMKDMDRQKLLEVLAHNPLFIRAAELQTTTLK